MITLVGEVEGAAKIYNNGICLFCSVLENNAKMCDEAVGGLTHSNYKVWLLLAELRVEFFFVFFSNGPASIK